MPVTSAALVVLPSASHCDTASREDILFLRYLEDVPMLHDSRDRCLLAPSLSLGFLLLVYLERSGSASYEVCELTRYHKDV